MGLNTKRFLDTRLAIVRALMRDPVIVAEPSEYHYWQARERELAAEQAELQKGGETP